MLAKGVEGMSDKPKAHTPGPWAWEVMDASMMTLGKAHATSGVDLAYEVLSVSRCKECQVDPDRLLCHMPKPEDAKLIASAPTMLQALRDIVRHQDILGGSMAHLSGTRFIAAQAIREATGEVV